MQTLNNLDFNLLKALHVLLEECNVTRAAERLALTQPAVSSILARLRHRLNDPLFVRSPRGMIPTDRALALAAPLAKIINDINQLMQPVEFNPADIECVFKIGMTDNGMQCVGVPLAFHLSRIAPKVQTACFSIQGKNVGEMLEKGELDLAVMSHLAVPENLRAKPLLSLRYVCAVRQDHPVLREQWDLERFCRLDFVLFSYFGGGLFGATDRALKALGKSRRVVMSVQSFLLIPDILRKSDWAAVVPDSLVKNADGLAMLDIPFPVEGYQKMLVWHERTHEDRIAAWLRGEVEKIAQGKE